MLPSRMAGGTAQSSSSSGIFFQGDGQSLVAGNSQLSSNFGNSSSSLPGNARANLGPVSGDVSNTVLNSVASSGPSVGESSLVTDANSGHSAGPHLQRSASINTESYMRLPASPMSFSSNNISISGSSVMDGSSVVQQSSNQDSGSQRAHQSQQHQGASSATSLPRMGQVQFPGVARVPNSFIQAPTTTSQLHKKPRLEYKHEDIVQQQVLQQLLQRQDTMHLQNSSPQLQALIHQQRLRQQEQQLLQTMPPIQRIQLFQQQQQQHQHQQQQQQQLQLRQQLQMQGMSPAPAVKRPFDGGICSRRLMQYMYHQRQRPADNTIAYWRKFVAEYYSPRAKQRWCLSLYDNVGHHSLGVFPQAAMEAWQCDICGSKSGRGFEATFEVLPRLNEIKFGSGVIEELLFLDLPRECRFPSGIMMLEYAKAVQESVYEQLRVVREGQLRIFFAPDLKILSWEFCARRHEELLPRRLVAPQVNQLLQVAQKCQNTISLSGADGVSQQDLQENSLRVVTAGRQLARSLEMQSLNDLGFSKRYVRCLQIADVLNSMKGLMDFCRDKKEGPIEGLKSFPRSNAQMQKMQELDPALNGQSSNNQNASGEAQALAMTNYQNLLMRQNSTNNSTQQEGSSPFNTSSRVMPATPYGSSGAFPGILQNSSINGFSGCQVLQQQQSQPPNGNGLLIQQSQSLPSQNNQTLHQQMVQQYLQEMGRKNNGGAGVVLQQQALPKQNPGTRTSGNGPADGARFKEAASSMSESTPAMGFGQKASDLTQGLHSSDDMVADIAHGFFGSDLDDIDFSWN